MLISLSKISGTRAFLSIVFTVIVISLFMLYMVDVPINLIILSILAIALILITIERFYIIKEKDKEIHNNKIYRSDLDTYEMFLEQIPVPIIFLHRKKITKVNNKCIQFFQAESKKDILGKSIDTFIKHEEKGEIFQHMRGSVTTEFSNLNRKLTDVKTFYHQFNHGEYGLVLFDKTEEKANERKLQHSEQLSVIGELAAGIAHEIRNPLTSIMGFLQLMDEKDESTKTYKEIMATELNRINLIVNELLLLSKPKEFEFETKNLVEIIETVVTIANTQAILYNIQIEVDCHKNAENVTINCEENKLKQVFLNLLKNGIEAMSKAGKIVIRIKKSNNVVHISFIDQGLGIPKEKISNLGKQFYTTKSEGTGLGLMISMNIIKEHNGELKISSEEGVGTEMKVILPCEPLQRN
ncbi:ATP-binding protein [Evansella sp. AB-P1]|uniref:ATP-binding protein n=1 Tax=Evansella sp. AB-P1 TaxID=3037653 RepID=UPI00241C5750|nr:ATP-binding protein [Evansella sp. AB-P1]MDG5787478.1 ATP-binding protein [Evansella sp. AB-P1]